MDPLRASLSKRAAGGFPLSIVTNTGRVECDMRIDPVVCNRLHQPVLESKTFTSGTGENAFSLSAQQGANLADSRPLPSAFSWFDDEDSRTILSLLASPMIMHPEEESSVRTTTPTFNGMIMNTLPTAADRPLVSPQSELGRSPPPPPRVDVMMRSDEDLLVPPVPDKIYTQPWGDTIMTTNNRCTHEVVPGTNRPKGDWQNWGLAESLETAHSHIFSEQCEFSVVDHCTHHVRDKHEPGGPSSSCLVSNCCGGHLERKNSRDNSISKRRSFPEDTTGIVEHGTLPRLIPSSLVEKETGTKPYATKVSTEPTTTSAQPKGKRGTRAIIKPLSPYNFFFSDVRDWIIRMGDKERAQMTRNLALEKTGICEGTGSCCLDPTIILSLHGEEHKSRLLVNHWHRDRSRRRPHRKSHGKVAFQTLNRACSSLWRNLPAGGKCFYREVADADKARYEADIKKLHGG